MSRPVWGAWIEIADYGHSAYRRCSRAPYGARGLKFIYIEGLGKEIRRAPYGARGLKWSCVDYLNKIARRAPYGARGLK